MESSAARSLIERSESLPDPRSEVNRLRRLPEVIAVCGVLVGCDGPTSIERWAKAKQEWLAGLLTLPNDVPSLDCLRRVLSALEPEAIDGKTLRCSRDWKNGLGPLHVVSAWASEAWLSLGQKATDEKSNEITAIPELLNAIDVKGAVVTIDAMGCQTAIAEKIVQKRGDYVLAVKENRPKLQAATQDFFAEHLENDCQSNACGATNRTTRGTAVKRIVTTTRPSSPKTSPSGSGGKG